MTVDEAAAQAELRNIVKELGTLCLRLEAIHDQLPVSQQETAMLLGEEDMDVATELRRVIECVLDDRLRPASRDLQDAAAFRPGQEADLRTGSPMSSSYLLILRRDQTQELGLPREEMLTRFKDFTQSLHEKGVLRGVERLKPAAEGTTARKREGTIAIEGAYDDSNESVIGFYLIEVADHDAAHEVAKECPILLAGGSVEIRETELFPKQ